MTDAFRTRLRGLGQSVQALSDAAATARNRPDRICGSGGYSGSDLVCTSRARGGEGLAAFELQVS
jgi:hypothetical protein